MTQSFRLLFKNKSFTELFLSSTLINLLSLALPFTILQIYDRILPNEGYGTATVLVIGVSLAILLELLLRYTRSWLLGASAANFELQSTKKLVERLLKADYHHIESLGTGKVFHGLNSISSMREIYSGQAAVALMDFPFVLIFLALVAYIGGPLVFIPILVWLIAGFRVWKISQKLTVATKELNISENEFTRLLMLVLSGLSTTKAMALESRITYTYKELNHKRLAQQAEVDWLSSHLQETIQGASQATTLALVLIGCFEVLNGDLTTGGLAACSILAGRAVAPLSAIGSLRAKFISAQSAMDEVNQLVAAPQESFNGKTQYQQKLPHGPISFSQVSIQQPNKQLTDINLEIPAGTMVTLRSNPLTNASLLLSTIGAYQQVEQGEITIAGVAQKDHDANEYRQSICYVAPWATLFNGSILDNLTLFRHERNTYAMELAHQLGLSEVIAQLPSGYQTIVGGNNNQLLNKGTVKLIAMVRALSQSPSILLLDEPMVSLDVESQARLLSLLQQQKGEMTILISSYFTEIANVSDFIIDISQSGHAKMTANKGAING
ncbi:ABC transporter transmembrane domain-containing protein [Shewanella sp. Isolate11]|uniref:ABC transporter transmembrane domain-containing protein n=1 Tax=Shewanella sp. Isolate11 TaxID=2908530 RepID=UPI001EFE7107|nr:ABC transporter transmembrane domain-containing protein [Shewanella sp. Isolate11]MCG9695573.1 ATP-binding cassette domain-containing protein [Shewanella sp. Isolate11]